MFGVFLCLKTKKPNKNKKTFTYINIYNNNKQQNNKNT